MEATAPANGRIRRATRQVDLAAILSWLKSEYGKTDSGLWGNRLLIERAFEEGQLEIVAVGHRPVAFLANSLSPSGILGTHPDFRRRGFARMMVEHAIRWEREQDVRCILEFECAPTSSIPFWRRMGFTVTDVEGQVPYARMLLERPFALPAGSPVDVVFERHPENSLCGAVSFPGTPPHSRLRAVRLDDGNIALDQRVIFPGPYTAEDPVVRLLVDGREVLFTKMKYDAARAIGIRRDRDGTFFVDRVLLPKLPAPTRAH